MKRRWPGIALFLQNQNIQTSIALSGREGIEKALQEKPDVIITDLMMPNVDGFMLMEKVLQQWPRTPIIVATAYGTMKTAVQALRLGAFDFLLKPLSADVVRSTVQKAAHQQQTRKAKTWQQTITTALGTLRDITGIAQQFLSLTAQALSAEGGVFYWPAQSTPPLFLKPDDAPLLDALQTWADAAGLTRSTPDARPIQVAPALEPEPPVHFSGSALGLRIAPPHTPPGILILTHSTPHYFDDFDAEFLEALVPFVTLAFENAQTYSRLTISNRQLSTLHSINALTYNAELPLQRVLRLAVEGIRQNMGYHAVFICLPEENGQSLSIRAACGQLDRGLHRRGDTPTRRIAFPLEGNDNPFSKTFSSQQTQNRPLAEWVSALEKANAPDMAHTLQNQPITHVVGLPLWRGDDVIGVLAVGHAHGETLPRQDKSLLTTLANQISLVITNATLYHSEQQRRREMEALYRAGLVITSTLSHAEVLKAIVQQIVELTFVESCIISRWNLAEDAEIIEVYLQKLPGGWTEIAPPGTRYPLAARPLVKEALEEQQLKIVSLDDPSLPSAERVWMTKTHAKLRLIMPLIVRNQSIGAIELITTRAHQSFTRHIIRLIQGLAAQASIALENARLHEAEVKRIEQEMDLARRIQLSLLPDEAPRIPGLSIAARSASARLVGGDFYRYLTLPDGRFGIVIGDVSGKGVPSALFMAITITALDTQLRQQTSPEGLLNRLNDVLYPRMQANRMNTGLLVGTFNLQRNEVEFANAGMIAPLIQQNNHTRWLDVSGLPVGADPKATYRGARLPLTPGTTILLVSDGILEAQNPAGELYGFERFEAAARQVPPDATSRQILDSIWQDTVHYLDGADPHDDMTLAVIKVESGA